MIECDSCKNTLAEVDSDAMYCLFCKKVHCEPCSNAHIHTPTHKANKEAFYEGLSK